MKRISTLIKSNQLKMAFAFYSLFFLILFIQFPLNKALPGNCDTWLALTLPSHTFESIKAFFMGVEPGVAMYPVLNPLAYGESAYAAQIMIMFIKLFGFADYWTNYIFISAIFVLTAFSIFIFAGNFVSSFYAKLFAGFVFACNNMTFAHIDDSVLLFFFLPALSLHFLYKYFKENKFKHLIISAVFAGIQIYMAFYVFLYLAVMIAVFSIVTVKKERIKISEQIKPALIFFSIVVFVALPNVLFYFKTLFSLDFVSPFNSLYTAKKASLNPISMALVLKNNLIYPDIGEMLGIPKNWGFIRHYCFTGLLALGLFIYSLFKWNRNRLLFLLFALTGVFMALGPVFQFNFEDLFYSPLYIFYKIIPILSFLRVTCRAHFIFLFAISVASAISFERLASLFPKKAFLLIPAFFLIHFVENTPFPMKSFDAHYTEKAPEIFNEIRALDSSAVILNLPSFMEIEYPNWDDRIYDNPHNFVAKNKEKETLEIENIGMFVYSWDNLFEYNREIIYFNWQTRHKLNTVNGVNGYFPTPRMMYQYQISSLPSKEAFQKLKEWNIDYVIWHQDMIIERDKISLRDLEKSPCLKKIKVTGDSHLFKLVECK
ncbi:MAG: hypothetical protein ACOX2F_01600 [bacterium]